MTHPSRSRVISETLGGSALSVALQDRRLAAELQPWRPSSQDDWRRHAAGVRDRAGKGWYDVLRPAFAASGAAKTRIERTAREGGIVVTTGQQAGLFGGPLYTLNKALTALALADVIEEHSGIPTAPVFWAATDDADFLEASITYVADAEGLHTLQLPEAPAAGTPMASAPLPSMTPLLEQLRRACGSASYGAYYEIARSAYTSGGTVGDAYVRMLRELLAPLGIAVMDSSHEAYRAASRPLLLETLRRAEDVERANAECVDAIRRQRYEPQVVDERGLSLVFAIEHGIKRRLSIPEARTAASDEALDAVLTPNVLLRPIVERELLPTAAYIGGPGELAYFIQTNAVARALDRTPMVAVARWSCTILEPFADKALRRLRARFEDVRDSTALEKRLATAALPESVATAWSELRQRLNASIEQLSAAVADAELMPIEVIVGLQRSLDHKLTRADRRLLAAVKRRELRTAHDLATVKAALFPLGQRQERMLNFIPMLTRGGAALVEDMTAGARAHASALLSGPRAEAIAAR